VWSGRHSFWVGSVQIFSSHVVFPSEFVLDSEGPSHQLLKRFNREVLWFRRVCAFADERVIGAGGFKYGAQEEQWPGTSE
jgi:hypothetical protein